MPLAQSEHVVVGWKSLAAAIGVPMTTLRRRLARAGISLRPPGCNQVGLALSVCDFLRSHFARLFR